jgi:hypothetical protein
VQDYFFKMVKVLGMVGMVKGIVINRNLGIGGIGGRLNGWKGSRFWIVNYRVFSMFLQCFFVNLRRNIEETMKKPWFTHHSSAILTSGQADLKDPEVKELAKEIIKSQEEEIAQMKRILERMD